MIYVFSFILAVTISSSSCISFSGRRISGGVRNLLLLLVFIFITFIVGFRFEVGTDYSGYVSYFDAYAQGLNVPRVELGHKLINNLVIDLGAGVQWVFFIYALLTNFFVYCLMAKLGNRQFLSIAILFGVGFFFLQTNQIRQALAASIIMFGAVMLVKRKPAYFYASIFASFFIHFSSVIMVILLLVDKLRCKRLPVVFLFPVGWGVYYSEHLRSSVLSLISLLSPTNYQHYIDRIIVNSSGVSSGAKVVFESFLLFVFLLYVSKFLRERKDFFYYNVLCIGGVLALTTAHFWAISRLHFYFYILYAVAIPWLCGLIESSKIRKYFVVLFFLYFLLLSMHAIIINSHGIMPYSIIFSW